MVCVSLQQPFEAPQTCSTVSLRMDLDIWRLAICEKSVFRQLNEGKINMDNKFIYVCHSFQDGADGSMLEDNLFELKNGCICCTVKDDLVTTLEALLQRRSKFDYVIIETTGLANPVIFTGYN